MALYAYASPTGLLQAVTDPAGTVTKTFSDNLGRKTYVAANWQNFVPPSAGTGNPHDRVTQYVYDGPRRVQQLVAMDPNGTGNLTQNQVTTYLYEDPVDANRNTSQIYPDSTDTTSSGTNQIKLAYNVDGTLSQKTDQRGVVIAFAYTNNRLLNIESVTTLPTGVDGAVQSNLHTYDGLNRPQKITSYAGTGGTGTELTISSTRTIMGRAKLRPRTKSTRVRSTRRRAFPCSTRTTRRPRVRFTATSFACRQRSIRTAEPFITTTVPLVPRRRPTRRHPRSARFGTAAPLAQGWPFTTTTAPAIGSRSPVSAALLQTRPF